MTWVLPSLFLAPPSLVCSLYSPSSRSLCFPLFPFSLLYLVSLFPIHDPLLQERIEILGSGVIFHSERSFISLPVAAKLSIWTASVIWRSIASFLNDLVTDMWNSCSSPLCSSRQCPHNGKFISFLPRKLAKCFFPLVYEFAAVSLLYSFLVQLRKEETARLKALHTRSNAKEMDAQGRSTEEKQLRMRTREENNIWRICEEETRPTPHCGGTA